jgi:hypothetical protein
MTGVSLIAYTCNKDLIKIKINGIKAVIAVATGHFIQATLWYSPYY